MSMLEDRLLSHLDRLRERPGAIPTPTPAPTVPGADRPRLTIGIATYDDFDGAWFTIASLRLHHPEVMDRAEILLLDNHPESRAAGALKELDRQIPNLRYLPVTSVRSTAVRDLIFSHARGEIVLVLDSHVLLASGALTALLSYLDAHPDSRDLVQGPLLAGDGANVYATHFVPEWGGGMYGRWEHDGRGDDPDAGAFDIPMQGLGVFACRRAAWPGLNPKFRGFGGEEGYLHEKVRRAGGRTVCLPALRWSHRFARPWGVPYRPTWEDRIRNYLIGWRELGLDDAPVREHFADLLGTDLAGRLLAVIDAELAHPAFRFDGVLCPNLDQRAARWRAVAAGFTGVGMPPTRVPAPAADHPEVARLLAHRLCIDFARLHGWGEVLVVDDDAEPAPDAARCLADLAGVSAPVLLLGGRTAATGATGAPAIGYHQDAYPALLDELPASAAQAHAWLATHTGLDAWLNSGAARVAVHAAARPFALQRAPN